jgi:hypothetical protein
MTRINSDKRKKAKRRIIIDSIMVFFIVIAPFIFKSHEYFPRNPEETITIFGFTIDSNDFGDLSTYAWFLLGKIIPLYLLFIWFFTCKHWWYHAILIPMTMYAFQLFEVIYSEDKFVDTDNLLWLLPICMVVIPFVYFIRVKLYDKHVHGIDLEAMEAELQELKEKPELRETEISADHLEKETPQNDSISDEINRKLSTGNIESMLRQLQHRLQDWLHLKF